MDILFFSYIFFFPLSLQILLPDLTVYMSNMAVTLSEAVSANSSRAPAFPIGFLVGSVLLTFFYVVLLCVSTFGVPCYDVCYDFRIKTMNGSSLSPAVCMGVRVLFTLVVFVCI